MCFFVVFFLMLFCKLSRKVIHDFMVNVINIDCFPLTMFHIFHVHHFNILSCILYDFCIAVFELAKAYNKPFEFEFESINIQFPFNRNQC